MSGLEPESTLTFFLRRAKLTFTLFVTRPPSLITFFIIVLVTGHSSLDTLSAAQLPSLFRGIVVAEAELGVRVLSVEPASQAYLADLRPEDIIVQVNDTSVHSLDEFAALSQTLKGHAVKATLVILRYGEPRQLRLHLYSYPLLQHWEVTFVPEHDVRFADPATGAGYWVRLGRGFETAQQSKEALDAYLNALHNVPTDPSVAIKAANLFWEMAHQQLQAHDLQAAVVSLQRGTAMLKRLFDYSLDADELASIKTRLEQVVQDLAYVRSTQGT